MRRRLRRWIIVLCSVAAVIAVGTVHAVSERATVEGLRYWSDIGFLDDYADELGIVMGRARASGSDPERYPRKVDGQGPGIETLQAAEDEDGATAVVLRLRRERAVRRFLQLSEPEMYEISACYRWEFGGGGGPQPARLSECPDTPVIELGPPPVVPTLPDGIVDVLREALAPLAEDEGVSEAAVADAVRSAYAEADRDAVEAPGADPEAILSSDEILAGDDWVATVEGRIGVAIGKDRSCVMARVESGEVRVRRPPRITLEPGEVGCSASWAARETDGPAVPGSGREEGTR